MSRTRLVLASALLLLAGLIAVVAWGGWFDSAAAPVRAVPPGSRELAWIAPATSGETWERLVAALKQLQRDWPTLHDGAVLDIDVDRAFLALTADIPEIGIRLRGSGGANSGQAGSTLWIRWYKLSGENDSGQWIASLRKRGAAPLAVIGGDTTDRALALAEVLEETRQSWEGSPPLFCITTATAERYFPRGGTVAPGAHEQLPKLMSVYPGRSFRFSFTNSRMVEAVLDFVRETPQVWLLKRSEPAVFAAIPAAANAWSSLGLLAASGHLQPYYVYTIAWGDDTYSKDLAEIFSREFHQQFQGDKPINVYDGPIPYGVGDYFQANPRERLVIDLFLVDRAGLKDEQHLLVLPASVQRARRFLRTLCQRAPLETRNLVVVNGDAMSFNSIYRDRDVAWNILDMPVPLVFFSHRNPISAGGGFDPRNSPTGTQDLLLHRDIIEAILHAAHDDGRPVQDTEQVVRRLRELRWLRGRVKAGDGGAETMGSKAFFDAEGNRASGTGEHVVWLQPRFDGELILSQAKITVWRVVDDAWRLAGTPLDVYYNRSRMEAGFAE